MKEKNNTLEFIEGFLAAFSALNTYTNHGATFTIESVVVVGNIQNSLDNYFKKNYTFSLQELTSDIQALSSTVGNWFFDVKAGGSERHPKVDDFTREYVVEAFIVSLKNFFEGKPLKIYKLDIDTKDAPFYELVWDDYVFESGENLYFLHFGMSD